MSTIDIDRLDYLPDGTYLNLGVPFTGYGIEIGQNGQLRSEIAIVKGKQHGISRGFFTDGTLESESCHNNGYRHGTSLAWHANGVMKEEIIYVWDIPIEWRKWNVDGTILECKKNTPEMLELAATQDRKIKNKRESEELK